MDLLSFSAGGRQMEICAEILSKQKSTRAKTQKSLIFNTHQSQESYTAQ